MKVAITLTLEMNTIETLDDLRSKHEPALTRSQYMEFLIARRKKEKAKK